MPVRKKASTKLPAIEKAAVMPEPIPTNTISNKFLQPKVFITIIIVILLIAAFQLKGLFIAAMVNGEPISRLTIIKELEKQGGKQALSSLD